MTLPFFQFFGLFCRFPFKAPKPSKWILGPLPWPGGMREAIEVLAAILTYLLNSWQKASTKSQHPFQATPPAGKNILGCGGLALASSIRPPPCGRGRARPHPASPAMQAIKCLTAATAGPPHLPPKYDQKSDLNLLTKKHQKYYPTAPPRDPKIDQNQHKIARICQKTTPSAMSSSDRLFDCFFVDFCPFL